MTDFVSPAVELRGITKHFGNGVANDGVDFAFFVRSLNRSGKPSDSRKD